MGVGTSSWTSGCRNGGRGHRRGRRDDDKAVGMSGKPPEIV